MKNFHNSKHKSRQKYKSTLSHLQREILLFCQVSFELVEQLWDFFFCRTQFFPVMFFKGFFRFFGALNFFSRYTSNSRSLERTTKKSFHLYISISKPRQTAGNVDWLECHRTELGILRFKGFISTQNFFFSSFDSSSPF